MRDLLLAAFLLWHYVGTWPFGEWHPMLDAGAVSFLECESFVTTMINNSSEPRWRWRCVPEGSRP